MEKNHKNGVPEKRGHEKLGYTKPLNEGQTKGNTKITVQVQTQAGAPGKPPAKKG